jgi:hypothetical protein
VIRVVYEQMDWLALWYLEDYFDLDVSQETQAKEMIARTLAWHRETQLPRYAVLTRNLLASIDGPVEPQFLAAQYDEVVSLWDDLLRRVSPDLSVLLQSLSDDQVDELFSNLADENRELAEDYSGQTREERRSKQDKEIIKSFRRFTGRLTAEQEVFVRSRTARFHDLSADWLDRRAAWQSEFRVLMTGRKSNARFAEEFRDLLLNPNQFDHPGYRKRVEDNQQASFRLVASVLGSLTPEQSNHLRNRLTTYASDFEALTRGKGQ